MCTSCPDRSVPEILYPENVTWISQDPELEWAGAHSTLDVVTRCLLSSLPIRGAWPLPGKTERVLTQQVIPDGKLSHGRHTQQQKGRDSSAGVTGSPGHLSLCGPSDTLKALAPSRRPCRREAACWAAAESG